MDVGGDGVDLGGETLHQGVDALHGGGEVGHRPRDGRVAGDLRDVGRGGHEVAVDLLELDLGGALVDAPEDGVDLLRDVHEVDPAQLIERLRDGLGEGAEVRRLGRDLRERSVLRVQFERRVREVVEFDVKHARDHRLLLELGAQAFTDRDAEAFLLQERQVQAATGQQVRREFHDDRHGVVGGRLAGGVEQDLADLADRDPAELDRRADIEAAHGVLKVADRLGFGAGEGAGAEEDDGGDDEQDPAGHEGPDQCHVGGTAHGQSKRAWEKKACTFGGLPA